jgi:hypothetical protein
MPKVNAQRFATSQQKENTLAFCGTPLKGAVFRLPMGFRALPVSELR